MNEDYDELDRALFALPLATPPSGMREAILRATSLGPAPAFVLGRYEIGAIGCVLAIVVWFALVLLAHPAWTSDFNAGVSALVRALAAPMTLLWFATGVSIAAALSFGPPGFRGRRLWGS